MQKKDIEQKLLNRFLRYVVIDTQSDHHSSSKPTTPGQLELLKLLVEELKELGVQDVELDSNGYLIARIPSNQPEHQQSPVIGFMAHVDTSGDMSGKGVIPQVITDYSGADIPLNSKWTLEVASNPLLKEYIGETIITTSGETLLGSDDKAGIAEIMTVVEYLLDNPEILHGPLEIIFTPDEETGTGMDKFPVEKLQSRCCYTIDGTGRGIIDTECFNAAKAIITFTGVMYHLGAARGRMVNAITLASAYTGMLPQAESPEATDGRYGYYCPMEISGTAEKAELTIYLRDFALEEISRREDVLKHMATTIEALYPGAKATVSIKRQYLNMYEYIKKDPLILQKVDAAAEELGFVMDREIIRGGTDGARLCEMGIPAPNIFTGGHNLHSRFEWAALPAMVDAVLLVERIISHWSKESIK